jgi:hypothetical protein
MKDEPEIWSTIVAKTILLWVSENRSESIQLPGTGQLQNKHTLSANQPIVGWFEVTAS